MSPVPDGHPTVELALSELRRSIDVGLTEIRGQLALLIQKSEQAKERADQQAKALEDLDDRVGKVERDGVTHDDLDRKNTRTIQIIGIAVALLGVVSGVGSSFIITLLN